MDYQTTRYISGWRSSPPSISSLYNPRLDGLPPISSETLVSTYCQDQDKSKTTLSQLKEENPTVNSLMSNYPQTKTFEPVPLLPQKEEGRGNKEAEYTDKSGDTELNTELESSCSIPDFEVLDYTTSRTLSEVSDEAKSVKPSFPSPPPQKEEGGENRIRASRAPIRGALDVPGFTGAGKKFTARRTPIKKGMRGYGTVRSHVHQEGSRGHLGARNLTEKSATLNLKRNELRDKISSDSVQKEYTNNLIKKRPYTLTLLEKLEQVVEEHFKDNTLEGNMVEMASADILSWKQIYMEDMTKEDEQKITEFSVNFKHISYI